jgi:hypothetical protein
MSSRKDRAGERASFVYHDKHSGDEMKKTLLVLILSAVLFIFAGNVPASSVATPGGDFIDMYRSFFRDMQANRDRQVWDMLTLSSKNVIAKTLNDSVIAMNKQSEQSAAGDNKKSSTKQYTQAEVLEMLNNNASNIRTEYFTNLNANFEKIAFYKSVLEGQYSVKSMAKDRIIITISAKNEPKDFQVLLEDGRWKINFFDDMMR